MQTCTCTDLPVSSTAERSGEKTGRGGARFNSALRFTAEHEDIIVVVVSSDRPVSVMRGGIELTAACEWEPFSEFASSPPTLEEWLAQNDAPNPAESGKERS